MGFVVFTLGNLMSIAGLSLAAFGYATTPGAGWIVALVASGEALTLGSVAFLSEDRVERPGSAAKAPPRSARRSYLGIGLLLAHLALYLGVWSAAVLSYSRATAEDPLPSLWGLSFSEQGPAFVWGVVAAELMFLAAAYVLGPEWRVRFSRLFRYAPPETPASPEAPGPPPTLRYRLGLAVFVVGNLLGVVGLLLPILGLANGAMVGVIAVMLGAGEVISLSSIFLLGKEGFKQLKSKLFRLFKRVPSSDAISHRRHRFGCSLLAVHVVLQFAALVFPIASHYSVVAEGTFPEVLGLGREQQLHWFVGLLATAELLFFGGVYALGGAWWGRFRDLFRIEP
jgi:hypothetical protein